MAMANSQQIPLRDTGYRKKEVETDLFSGEERKMNFYNIYE